MVKQLHPNHDWIIAFRADGRLISQLAHRRGVIKVKCSTMQTEERGRILEGRLVFAKIVSTFDNVADDSLPLMTIPKLRLTRKLKPVWDR
jgi:hypothetical protein